MQLYLMSKPIVVKQGTRSIKLGVMSKTYICVLDITPNLITHNVLQTFYLVPNSSQRHIPVYNVSFIIFYEMFYIRLL